MACCVKEKLLHLLIVLGPASTSGVFLKPGSPRAFFLKGLPKVLLRWGEFFFILALLRWAFHVDLFFFHDFLGFWRENPRARFFF